MIKIGLACDHAGFELKEFVKAYVEQNGYVCQDFGCYTSDSCDYPDYAHPLAEAVEIGETKKNLTILPSYDLTVSNPEKIREDQGGVDLGIALCGSGNGIGMTLNKHQGIRAAICWNVDIAKVTRAHNDANILVLPARFISQKEAAEMVDIFLSTPFDGGRHQRRIEKIPI